MEKLKCICLCGEETTNRIPMDIQTVFLCASCAKRIYDIIEENQSQPQPQP